MAKKRWRAIKNQEAPTTPPESPSQTVPYFERFKAQVVDTFMIYTPILYITTYFILGGAQEFRESDFSAFLAVCMYGIISAAFIAYNGQTPGLRAHELMVVDKQSHKIGFMRALGRFFIYLVSMLLFCGIFIPRIWRSKTTLHDLICRTQVIRKSALSH